MLEGVGLRVVGSDEIGLVVDDPEPVVVAEHEVHPAGGESAVLGQCERDLALVVA
jgi:hypothetical protein